MWRDQGLLGRFDEQMFSPLNISEGEATPEKDMSEKGESPKPMGPAPTLTPDPDVVIPDRDGTKPKTQPERADSDADSIHSEPRGAGGGPRRPIPVRPVPGSPNYELEDLRRQFEAAEYAWKGKLERERTEIVNLERKLAKSLELEHRTNDKLDRLARQMSELQADNSKLKTDLAAATTLPGGGGPYPQGDPRLADPSFRHYWGLPPLEQPEQPPPDWGPRSPPGQPSRGRGNGGHRPTGGERHTYRRPSQEGGPAYPPTGPRLKLTDYMPRRFDGVKNVEGKAHIDCLNDYFSIQNIDNDRRKVDLFKLSLEGQARIWLDPIKEAMSYERLSMEFVKHFAGITSYQSNLHRFRSLKWNETESLELYKQKLLLLSQIIGNEKPGEGYSRELKTQFKLGLPMSYQTHMTDLDEDSSLEAISKRAQTLWDTKRLNQTTASQVTFADTTTGLGMMVQNQTDPITLPETKDLTDSTVQKIVKAIESKIVDKSSNDKGAYVAYSDRKYPGNGDRYQENQRYRSNSRDRYRNDSRDNYRNDSRERFRGDNRERFRSNSRDRYRNDYRQTDNRDRFRNNSRERYRPDSNRYDSNRYDNNRSRFDSWDRGKQRDRTGFSRDRYNNNRSRSWSSDSRGPYKPFPRSRDQSRERNGENGPEKGGEYRSVKDRDATPAPGRSCYGCHSTSHFMRECPVLYKDLKNHFGDSQG